MTPDKELNEKKEIIRRYRALIRAWHSRKKVNSTKQVLKAFRMALKAHEGMRRRSGEPYIYHPLEVARIVAGEIGLGETAIISALLHDVVEDNQDYSIELIRENFGDKVAYIVDGLTKIQDSYEWMDKSVQAENIRKMMLTLSDDVRVILIKLADRLHNMQTLNSMHANKQKDIAAETIYIYIPIAHRLGLYNIKNQLEDLALKYNEPEIYKTISASLRGTETARKRYIDSFFFPIKKELARRGIEYSTDKRVKSVYSVYKKMQDKKLQSAEDINDMLALRIIIESPDDELIEKEKCMQVYNIITNFYKPRIEQFRDYISNPKPNGYKAIHTTVMGPEGRWVEVQIRTHRMHDFAERGVAAHWKYKKVPGISSSIESGIDKWMAEVHRILLSNDADSLKILDDIKLTLYSDEIFVWTPRGQLLNMPRGSTVLDFAYRLHSDLGNRCIGANLNRRNVVPLNHVLLSGDQIEIIESKNSSPKDEYLNYIITSHAKLSLKEALRKKRQKLAPEGRKKLEKLFEEYNVEFTKKNIDKLFSFLRMPGPDELFYEVYRDNFLPENIQRCFKQGNKPLPLTESSGSNEISYSEHKAKHAQQHDLDKFKVLQSECCHPLPGDDVIAYSTDERLYQLHRISCGNAIEYSARFENRTLYGNWENRPNGFYLGGIRITGFDRRKMIFDIINVIDNEMKFDIKQFHIGTTGAYFEAEIIVAVHNRLEIEQAIDKLKQLDKILDVQRIYEFKLKNG